MSETPQQHGWQPLDSDEPADQAQSPRGFGLFEAPDAPEEFPVFTPFSEVGQATDDFPPDSGDGEKPAVAFPGFPSEEQAYVPAPAAMPIPGVAHDAFASEAPPVAPAPEVSEAQDARDVPEQSAGEPAGSWSAFAAGDSRRPPPTPLPWEAPESLTSPEPPTFPGFEPPPAPAPYEPFPDESAPAEPSGEPEPAPVAFHDPAPSPIPAQPAPPVVQESPPPVVASPPVVAAVRAAATAPVANRLNPDEVPAAMPKPTGRVYGSAAVASSPVSPAAPFSPAAPADVPAAEPATTPIRATARPVHIVQPDPGDMVPAGRSSTIYGSPANASAVVAPAAPPPTAAGRPGRGHAFGDLLPQQAASEVQMHGTVAPPQQMPQTPLVPAQRAPQQPPMAAPAPAAPFAPQSTSLDTPYRDPQQAQFDQFTHQQPARIAPEPAEGKVERKGRLIVGVLAGCAALLVAAFGVLFLIDQLVSNPTFKVGDCVKQIGQEGVEQADCTEAGAFHIVSSVTDQKECDQTQPFVQQADKVFCLAPAGAAVQTPQPQASQSP